MVPHFYFIYYYFFKLFFHCFVVPLVLSLVSVWLVDGSVKELSIGAGGKKNRQKERRLMKGFNIAPQPSGSGTLPPVAEFIASLQHAHDEQHHELFGSTLSGIFGPGTTPKKSPHHTSTNSVPGLGTGARPSRESRHGSRKRRWGTIIEAAKSGRVSRLIGNKHQTLSIIFILFLLLNLF